MKLTKKLLCLIVAIAIYFSIAIPVFAVDSENQIPSDEKVQNYALHFMNKSQHNNNLEINEFLHLYDTDGSLTGYYVTFSDGLSPSGYILLSLISGEDPIVEFSFEGGGIIDTASSPQPVIESINSIANNTSSNSNILYIGPGEIYIPIQNNMYYSVYDQEYTTVSDSASTHASRNSILDGIIDWSQASVDSNTVVKIKNFGSGTDYWLIGQLKSGNVCTPVAATNILWYWGKNRNSSNVMNKFSSQTTDLEKATTIFNFLYTYMGTTNMGTRQSRILDGYKGFFGVDAGRGIWNYSELPSGTPYVTFARELLNSCPIHIILYNKSDLSATGGHSAMTFGSAKSTSGAEYLFVMDGFYAYGRFVKFNYYPYVVGYKICVA